MKSTLRLFRALPIETKKKKKATKTLLEKTIHKGFVFSPEVIHNYPEAELMRLADIIEQEMGLTPEQMNSSFHKSWQKIAEADIGQLVVEQVVHYITTYGFEQMGIYSESSVYIPNEKLEIPDIDIENISLVVIHGYTKEELKEKLLRLLGSGIALAEKTIESVVDIALWLELSREEIEAIKNKETRIILYDYLGIVPQNPTEFLRYIVYKAADKTLLIKSNGLIEEIKTHKNVVTVRLFSKYEKEHGLEKLAEIFYRFKPLFLAFKTNTQLSAKINKLRKLAVKYHKPMKEDYLNTVTARLKRGETINRSILEKELGRVNTFRKIRLAYALKFRTKDCESILYRIRNGKGYATDFDFHNRIKAEEILNVVLDFIVEDIKQNVNGKNIYIPEYMHYALPATEKQFTGFFPSGTYVSLDRDMIFGINWQNVKSNRIDLDLSLMNANVKYGWDGYYRDSELNVLFSGDMTNASDKNGATELFYVKRQEPSAWIMFVNYFNFNSSVEVPYKIVVAKERINQFNKNHMIDPNNVMAIANSTISQKQKVLGLISITENDCKFYFAETYLGRSITASNSKFAEHSRRYLFNFYENTINFNEILTKAGATIMDSKGDYDINLAPEKIEKDTIINLLI